MNEKHLLASWGKKERKKTCRREKKKRKKKKNRAFARPSLELSPFALSMQYTNALS